MIYLKGMRYYRVTINKEIKVQSKRSFWIEVVRESKTFVVGWEMTEDGERTHKQHMIERKAATFTPARMNHTYATMEII